jgi:hypothetical protein
MSIKVADLKKRTISAEVMKDVATFLPMDSFKLSSDLLGQEFSVVDVIYNKFQGRNTFSVVLQNADRTVNISAGLLKKARVLTSSSVVADKFFNGNAKMVLRSDADDLWNNSRYLHAEMGMKENDDLVLPKTICIEYAVLQEDQTKPGTPRINPIFYDGFRKAITQYQPESFPTMDDFKGELKKTGADRIAGLPTETEPKLLSFVKANDPATMVYTLVLKDTLEKSE